MRSNNKLRRINDRGRSRRYVSDFRTATIHTAQYRSDQRTDRRLCSSEKRELSIRTIQVVLLLRIK